ncbi:hypothetical protein [Bdellovibrio reynosensis]|uniref:Uncharacterized protein n=1 Tax=Bdellovibrio reynosensis TaxID=2835041 RepID=A0ABY4C9F2_9BACT|nr:hypothetical protein [Bdellovibrio reynosensis]UOF01560.1 hypothetical protein MNR06_01155 [Bdellovibrio reynosensis]
MLSKIFVSFLASLTLVSAAKAYIGGDEKGNGGVVIRCSRPTLKYEVLDLFEGRAVHGIDLEFEDAPTYFMMVDKLIDRIARVNPSRAGLYRGYLLGWVGEARMIPGVDFTELPDKGWGTIPNGCELRQAVVQFKKANLNGFKYFVNADIWESLDEKNKAALVMHEFIYREGLKEENDFTSSVGVRYFNAVVHSAAIKNLSLAKYFDVLRNVGFQAADAHGYGILLHSGRHNGPSVMGTSYAVLFHDENNIASAVLSVKSNSLMVAHNTRQAITCGQSASGVVNEINFYLNNTPRDIKLNCNIRFSLQSESGISAGSMLGSHFTYHQEDGSLNTVRSYSLVDQRVSAAFNFGNDRTFSINRGIDNNGKYVAGFFPSGAIRFLCMGRHFTDLSTSWITTDDNSKVTLNDGRFGYSPLVHFSEDGSKATTSKVDCNTW